MKLACRRWIDVMEIVTALLLIIAFVIKGLVDLIQTGTYFWFTYLKKFFSELVSSGLFFAVLELIQIKIDSRKAKK